MSSFFIKLRNSDSTKTIKTLAQLNEYFVVQCSYGVREPLEQVLADNEWVMADYNALKSALDNGYQLYIDIINADTDCENDFARILQELGFEVEWLRY